MRFIFLLLILIGSKARATLCVSGGDDCTAEVSSPKPAPAYPSDSSSFNLNPAAVPTKEGFGIEVNYFKSFDFAIVKGTGRVGAGASLSNGQGDFFGPPSFETDPDFYQRSVNHTPYAEQNISLAGAVDLYDNKKEDLKHFRLSLGLIAQYNKTSARVFPGTGLSVTAGPVTIGYSVAEAQTVVDRTSIGDPTPLNLIYSTQTASVGVLFKSLALDYSIMKVYGDFSPATISLFTGSLLLKRWIISYSYRTEDSQAPAFDHSSGQLVSQELKYNDFYGLQFAITKHILINAFYNYYLLNDISAGATLLF